MGADRRDVDLLENRADMEHYALRYRNVEEIYRIIDQREAPTWYFNIDDLRGK